MAAIPKNGSGGRALGPGLRRLDALVRSQAGPMAWSRARRLVETGKVRLAGTVVLDPGHPVPEGEILEICEHAPRPETSRRLSADSILHLDAHLVVVRKPAGVSSVPYEPGERGTLVDLVRAWLNRSAERRRDRSSGELGVVQRLDKETSGLIVFARNLAAKRILAHQLRLHSVERRYVAIAQGSVRAQTLRSRLVKDRGDGVRGSTHDPNAGLPAITHVRVLETLAEATLVECRLETGRTHQIRIHLGEAGHPLAGERVYSRGFRGSFLAAPRLMLHAAVLGFDHPVTHQRLRFEDPIPGDMLGVLAALRGGGARCEVGGGRCEQVGARREVGGAAETPRSREGR
jgi:23S rRNA pseudouridine1911/1915/1917 synthase